ncbi:hypothetical protein BRADI_1g00415v3 [Brachypodium distachyon]|uniref:Uncharacterized protein n=1 Tax=Brachypodium distachyon TaxID=15368 RepID=A0A2K2DHH2_BRADI|nr:hypothetical protein BRADI_1g00415v3 [Brachypodium distachyon]
MLGHLDTIHVRSSNTFSFFLDGLQASRWYWSPPALTRMCCYLGHVHNDELYAKVVRLALVLIQQHHQ